MEEKNEFELIVSEGTRPPWKIFLSALFFTYMFYYFYLMFQLFLNLGFCEQAIRTIPRFLEGICYGLSGGIAFSVAKTVLIDVNKDKLISRYFVGPFSKDILAVVPNLEYVSVFLDAKGYHQVNLWYKGNKHYKMYSFDKKILAMRFALQVSNKLNIELLDATEKGNSKWIDKTNI